MNKWWNIVKESSNPNTLLMLSGGKDSIAALVFLKKKKIPVTAIHFFHRWGEDIPSTEAERICRLLGVELIKIDYSEELYSSIESYTDGRPCLICKKQMYSCLDAFLKSHNYGWLAIGDNANDTTTIARMKMFDNSFGDNLECSEYFGSEMGIKLPLGMHVLRPLINMSADEVERALSEAQISVKRINSTGDKYFEYHREGCPIQFIDNGYPIDIQTLEKLKEYNAKITEFARANEILASIHIPSTFIVTIPKGYEKKAAQYLTDSGLYVNEEVNFGEKRFFKHISVILELVGTDIRNYKTYRKLFMRLIERLGMSNSTKDEFEVDEKVVCIAFNNDARVTMTLDNDVVLSLDFVFQQDSRCNSVAYIENLLIEIFRTRKISISS